MAERSVINGSYRFGYNGMELDNELKGIGNSYDFGARMYDSRVARWTALDPLAAKYPSLSPYNFVVNSPLMFIDPDGRVIKVAGEEAQVYVSQLTEFFGGRFKFDLIDGVLKVEDNQPDLKLPQYAQLLIDAIDDPNITVNIHAFSPTEQLPGETKAEAQMRDIGSYRGTIYTDNKVVGTQHMIPSLLRKAEEFHEKTVGTNILHETLENYVIGTISLKAKFSDWVINGKSQFYNFGHNHTSIPKQSGPFEDIYIDRNGNETKELLNTKIFLRIAIEDSNEKERLEKRSIILQKIVFDNE